MSRPSPHPPLTTILILGTSLGLIAGLPIGAGLGGLSAPPRPVSVPAAEPVVQVLVTIPPWPTPERTPTPTPYPTYQQVPTSTPWPHYDPRYATPGRLYLIPPPTPFPPTPYPACSLALPPGSRCVAVAATAMAEGSHAVPDRVGTLSPARDGDDPASAVDVTIRVAYHRNG